MTFDSSRHPPASPDADTLIVIFIRPLGDLLSTFCHMSRGHRTDDRIVQPVIAAVLGMEWFQLTEYSNVIL